MSDEPPELIQIVWRLADELDEIDDPKTANALLVGAIIANLVGRISETKWRRMMQVAGTPCDEPGCNDQAERLRL